MNFGNEGGLSRVLRGNARRVGEQAAVFCGEGGGGWRGRGQAESAVAGAGAAR